MIIRLFLEGYMEYALDSLMNLEKVSEYHVFDVSLAVNMGDGERHLSISVHSDHLRMRLYLPLRGLAHSLEESCLP